MASTELTNVYTLRVEGEHPSWGERVRAILGGGRGQVYDQNAATAALQDSHRALLLVVDEWVRSLHVDEVEIWHPSIVRPTPEPATAEQVLEALGTAASALPDGLSDGAAVPWRVALDLLDGTLTGSPLDFSLSAEGRAFIFVGEDHSVILATAADCDHLIEAAAARGVKVDRQLRTPVMPDPEQWDPADEDLWRTLGSFLGDDPNVAEVYPFTIRRVENAEIWHLVKTADDLARIRPTVRPRDLIGLFDEPLIDPQSEDGVDLAGDVMNYLDNDTPVLVVLVDEAGALRTFMLERGGVEALACLDALSSASLAQVFAMDFDEPNGSAGFIAAVPDADGVVRARWS